jgi:HlyD family secretion protein
VWIDEPNLSRVRLGDPVEVRVDGRNEMFQGTVSFISPTAEFTPKNVQTPEERAKLVFRIKVTLDNTDGIFKPGMPADAFFGAKG